MFAIPEVEVLKLKGTSDEISAYLQAFSLQYSLVEIFILYLHVKAMASMRRENIRQNYLLTTS
jgi:hypothetical protein